MVRHAETVSNKLNETDRIISGRCPTTPLTDAGITQAQAMGVYFKHMGIKFSGAYASTALRTQQTAKHCFEAMGDPICLKVDDNLSELSPGDWEGRKGSMYGHDTLRKTFDVDNWNFVPGDVVQGESQRSVAERMLVCIKKIVLSHCKKETDFPGSEVRNVIIFSHGLAIKCLLAELLDEPRNDAFRTQIDNTGLTILRFEGTEFKTPPEIRNERPHLTHQ